MTKKAPPGRTASNSRALMIAQVFLGFVFICGGASRADTASLPLLRPCAAIILIWSLSRLSWPQLREWRPLFALAVGCMTVTAVQLIPVPMAWWKGLPGHEAVANAASVAGPTASWTSISLTPSLTWNALFALLVPFAVIAAAVRLEPEQRYSLARVVLLFGAVSAIVAIGQAASPDADLLYFYRVPSREVLSGMMANRDHQAALLAAEIPILAAIAFGGRSASRLRPALCFGAIALLVTLLLVTGSRAGIVLGILAVTSIPLILSASQMHQRIPTRWLWSGILVGTLLLSGLTLLNARALSLERLAGTGDDPRFQAWPLIWSETKNYFPVGSGLGSFSSVFQIDEPDRLLRPTFLNHAHNDWLESALCGGLPAIAVICFATFLYACCLIALWRWRSLKGEHVVFARLGMVIVTIFALASLVDYPLRTPALVSLFAVAAIWTGSGLRGMRHVGEGAERPVRRF